MVRRYYRRYYKRYYRRKYRRRYYRRYRRRVLNKNSKSTARVKIRRNITGSVTITAGNTDSLPVIIMPWAERDAQDAHPETHMLELVTGSSAMGAIFNTYGLLYEQFKLDFMSVKVTCSTPLGASTVPTATFTTCWDRNYTWNQMRNHLMTGQNIRDSPSSRSVTAVQYNIPKFRRSVAASDLQERIRWGESRNTTSGNLEMANGDGNKTDHHGFWSSSWANPTSNPQTFSPCFYMVVSLPTAVPAQQTKSLTFMFEITYYVSFRSPRYGMAADAEGGGNRELPAAFPQQEEQNLDGNRRVRFEMPEQSDEPMEDDNDDDDLDKDQDKEFQALLDEAEGKSPVGDFLGRNMARACRLISAGQGFDRAARAFRLGSPARRAVKTAEAICDLIRAGRSKADAMLIIGRRNLQHPGQMENFINDMVDAYRYNAERHLEEGDGGMQDDDDVHMEEI